MNFEEKRCPHCGALLVENASFCPYCESVLIEKRPAEMPKPKRRRRITAALLLAAILVVTLTAVGFADHGKVIVDGKEYKFPEYPPFITELIREGGLMNLVKEGKI